MSTFPEPEECNLDVNEVLQILGNKWSFLVIGQLSQGTQRFNELRRKLSNINTQSLTDTLRHLEQSDVIQRKVFPTVPVTVEYSLTEKGRDFQTVLYEMRNWGKKWRNQQNDINKVSAAH
jgi:DNA-binding HxlR family transcriptional regulator